ncbi:MAG: nitronate monooxygenase [Polyangia bacterium]
MDRLSTEITDLFGVRYPIVQGGMIWVAGAELAAAVSEAGGLGLIGAGSMDGELLDDQISKLRSLSNAPFGVNVPLAHRHADECIERAIEAENQGTDRDRLSRILGRGRARLGIFEGEIDEGELEIGQAAGRIRDVPFAGEVVRSMIDEYRAALASLPAPSGGDGRS